MPGLPDAAEKEAWLGFTIGEKRRQRADRVPLAKPQAGVDALKSSFPNRKPIPGVVDKQAGGGAPSPEKPPERMKH